MQPFVSCVLVKHMQAGMLPARHNLQVFNAIVPLLVVLVVHMLIGVQPSPDVLLHHIAVF
jgi:hypothetical protein